MSDTPICPCQGFDHPKTITNAPGLSTVDYRVGDYVSFRHALLLSLDGEQALTHWRPGASGDLGVQMVEWWAYLADVLSFYSWRSANNSYLRTADMDESVRGLIRILGYRPRPGIGSTGTVAAVLDGKKSITVSQGFQIQSKPKVGGQPQMFEVSQSATFTPQTDFEALAPDTGLLFDTDGCVRLEGVVDSVKKDDVVVLVKRAWDGTASNSSILTVASTKQDKDLLGDPYTKVYFTSKPNWPNAKAADYQLLRSQQMLQLWHFGEAKPASPSTTQPYWNVHMTTLARSMKAGELILFNIVNPNSSVLCRVGAITDSVWYMSNPDNPTIKGSVEPVIVSVHSNVWLSYPVTACWNSSGNVNFDFRDVGTLLPIPVTSITATTATLVAVDGDFPALQDVQVVVEDVDGNGASATAFVGANPASTMELSDLPDPAITLKMPVNVHTATLSVSRGETVASEILGSGDASIENQEFTLKKSPVTYLAGESISGDGYASTIKIWVDGVQWQEVPILYGQPEGAKVFVTWEDDDEITHVRFGSRLPTGKNNIVASYRFGSGAETPDPGDLSIIVKPLENLKKIVSAAVLTPGSDPDPADQIKRYAPRSVLTFGRAVSGDDFETIAAQAPGVTRARSYWSWDPKSQRATVTVYVGDGDGAVSSALSAIRLASDPNRPVNVVKATEVCFGLLFSLRVDPKRVSSEVIANVRTALTDPDTGLFGDNVVRIGQIFFNSDIYSACLAVPGVLAVHGLFVFSNYALSMTAKHDPGEGKYFRLLPEHLFVAAEVSNDAS